MEIRDVKRFNLALLASLHGGRKELAAKLGYTDTNHFNQMCGGFAEIGNGVTSKIYSAVDLPPLWLETPHVDEWDALNDKPYRKWQAKNIGETSPEPTVDDPTSVNATRKFRGMSNSPGDTLTHGSDSNQGHVHVQSYEMWCGIVEQEIRFMSVQAAWLAAEGVDADQLVSIEMPDNSFADRILKGDYVAINVDWGGAFVSNEVYAVMIGGSYTLRRAIIQASGKLVLQCRNRDFPDDVVEPGDIESLDVLGIFAQFQGMTP